MLFNTYVFILLFLPATVALFHLLRRLGRDRAAILFLVAASFFFYAWWSFKYVFLMVALMGADFAVARAIQRWRDTNCRRARALLALGVAINLGALGYYKYANFFVDNIDALFGLDLFLPTIVLPIGISFYTFQKIAFLVDLYRHQVERFQLLDYALFVTFFPQLIAGPIVHHSEVIPQFARLKRISRDDVLGGITIFVIGLTKKVLLADNVSVYASPLFSAAALGDAPDLLSSWSAVLAYTAQIYYDFSAYSDMAIGIGLLFGIRLPVNFNSPYKARSIIDFWRRWHITLSRVLRDYLYIALGGNRRGQARRYLNLYLTMVLGGIWHGAGWTFLIWGALHGIYLIINHAWHRIAHAFALTRWPENPAFRLLSWTMTFLAVVLAWVFFRAADLGTALDILAGMRGAHGVGALPGVWPLALPLGLLLLAVVLPNTQQIMGYVGPAGAYGAHPPAAYARHLRWKPNARWAVCIGVLLALCLMSLSKVSEFIYFQF